MPRPGRHPGHLKLRDPASEALLSTLQASVERGAGLVKQLLTFARGSEGERQVLELHPLISEIGKLLRQTFPRNIEVLMNVPRDLWLVTAEATQIHQVLMNLCVNARDAMPQGGRLTITARNQLLDETYAHMRPEARPGRYAVLEVEDTGTGIPADLLERIFDAFFTTKEPGQGTGLGLSTVQGIVKGHGGFLDVESAASRGARFSVYLPAQETGQANQAVAGRVEPPGGRGERILVVDDEASVREITTAPLEASGYRAVTAQDGAEAVALYAKHQEEIAVVLADMSMPILDGPATVRALLTLNSAVRIIAMSGRAANETMARDAGPGVKAFLGKPYTATELLTTTRRVLDAN
ncbi:MAG: response regulator [Planctomycetes bacterium]|nr:response regulator [Planctomycetota bacterium]